MHNKPILTAFTVFLLFAGSSWCIAAEELATTAQITNKQTGLQTLDWVLIAFYAASTIGLGIYFSRRQESAQEYFLGRGNMNPFFIGVSLFATLLSTISYLSMPGEAAGKGPAGLAALLGLPIIYFVVGYGMLDAYMKQRVTSAYELLEDRLDLSVRLLGATMFLMLRLVWMTLLIYLAAKAMTVMIGVDYWQVNLTDFSVTAKQVGIDLERDSGAATPIFFTWHDSELRIASIPIIVLFTGIVALTYTTLGGLQAVVITDFAQTVLLFGGGLLVLATITYDFGGFGWFPTEWHANWDSQPIISFNPKTRASMFGMILSSVIWYIATVGGDQTSVQRFMATRDTAAARKALRTQLYVAGVVEICLYLVGFALLAFFFAHPDALPTGMNLRDNADDLFPRFISFHLPIGVSGLVVAAMFAAAMSSIDSGVNSITAVVLTDFMGRFGWQPKSERSAMKTAKLLAFGIGFAVVLGSSFMKYIEGNITAVTAKTVNLFSTPLFGLFFFALFVKRAHPLGVWVGAICGITTAIFIAFSGPIVYFLHVQFDIDPTLFNSELIVQTDTTTGSTWTTAEDPISFQWIGPVALLVNIACGYVACLLFKSGKTDPSA